MIVACALMAATPLRAAAPDNTALAPGQLDALVVTSSGEGEPEALHPGNISVISPDEIDFVKPKLPNEILNRVAGVNIQQGSGLESLVAIRSPVLSGGAGAGSFLYLEDGVPMRAAGFANVNALFDVIDEVSGGTEIVRGPASALYGSNAEHGLINFLSAPPSLDPETGITAYLGPHGTRNAYGTTSDTFRGEGLTSHGVRATLVLNQDADGFRDSSGYTQEKGQLRYDYSNAKGDSVSWLTSIINLNQDTAGYVIGPDAYKNPSLYKSNPSPDAYRKAWAFRSAARYQHNFDARHWLTITPYVRDNAMNFTMQFQPQSPIEKSGHKSIGALSRYYWTTQGGHQIILGLDTEQTEGFVKETQTAPTQGQYTNGTHYDYTVGATVIAPYAQLVYALGPRTQVTAGLRYEYTRYDYRNNTTNGTQGLFKRIPNQINNYNNLTPKLGLVHVFAPEAIGFINLARAARAPQTTDLYRLQSKQGVDSAKSETLDSIEVGARGVIEKFTYSLSAYYMHKAHFYFRDADGFNVSDGKTNHMGLEGEFATPLIWGFDLAGSATWARHVYDFNSAVSSTSNSTEAIIKGNDVDTAPRTIANFRLGYEFLDERARAELEWQHMGQYWMDPTNEVSYPGYDLFNFRIDYALTETVSVFGRVLNLFNTRYADRADYAFGQQRYFPGADRAFYAGLSLSF
ncbi:MAG: TonB-dependent receptor [Parvibaculaceae bacterium]|nr:TonB-dependent receptor [Parvibaculaceae bacterium]